MVPHQAHGFACTLTSTAGTHTSIMLQPLRIGWGSCIMRLLLMNSSGFFKVCMRNALKWAEHSYFKKLFFHAPSRYHWDWCHHPLVSTVIVYECEQASFLQWQRACGWVDIVWDSDIRGRGEDPRKTTFILVPLWKPGWPQFFVFLCV